MYAVKKGKISHNTKFFPPFFFCPYIGLSNVENKATVLQDVEKDEKLRKLEKERRRIEKEKELYETRQREQAIILRVQHFFSSIVLSLLLGTLKNCET
jgi:hypothetical protein